MEVRHTQQGFQLQALFVMGVSDNSLTTPWVRGDTCLTIWPQKVGLCGNIVQKREASILTIREYQDRDLSELLEVWYQASLIAHPFLDEAFLSQERENIAKVYLPITETWIYLSEGKVVGFISLIGNEVGAIFVEPAFQKQGIGSALMDCARALREELEVDVFKANRGGRRFYERYGFLLERAYIHEQTGQPMLSFGLRES